MRIEGKTIILDKALNTLDQFVLDFVRVLGEREYAIVSGYVSILFGRSRSSEDIDLVLAPLSEPEFLRLFDELAAAGFECINTPREQAYGYLRAKTAVRFARAGQAVPNMEFKFAETPAAKIALKDRLCVKLGTEQVFISPIELQIAYKRACLKSDKDLEDARHLEIVFDESLAKEKVKYYERFLETHGC